LLKAVAQGKHRYYQLAGEQVAAALEALLLVAGVPRARFIPNTLLRLRQARSCYDHMAGAVAVAVHDYMLQRGWLLTVSEGDTAYELSDAGSMCWNYLDWILLPPASCARFACSCLDWSELTPHIGGALRAALLKLMLQRSWVERDLDSRALGITRSGVKALQKSFYICV
jgi:hypothetical protein